MEATKRTRILKRSPAEQSVNSAPALVFCLLTFSLAHDRWINLSHRQKLASRKRDFSGVAENSSDRERTKKGEAEHQTCWITSNAIFVWGFF